MRRSSRAWGALSPLTALLFMLFSAGCGIRAASEVTRSGTQPVEVAIDEKAPSTPAGDEEGVGGLPKVSVEILGPVSSLKGHAWPRGYDWSHMKEDQPRGMATADRPHELIVRLPSRRTLRHISKTTFFGQHNGTVEDAEFLPHPGQLKFQDVIALLELILNEWNAEPDEMTKELIQRWKAEGDVAPHELVKRRGRAKLRGEEKISMSFQIRPGRTGWLLWIMVGATMEERRRILGLPDHPPEGTK